MNAFGFSDNKKVNMETLKVSSETIDKNNFSNMKLLKSIYDESFDVANEFFQEGFKSKPKSNSQKESDKKKADAKAAAEKAKQSAKEVEDAKRKVEDAKKDSDRKVEEAEKDVADAKQDAKEAKEDAKEATEEANDAEEVAAVEGDDEGFEDGDGDDEGFEDGDDEGFEDDLIEGMKSKSKSKKIAIKTKSKSKKSMGSTGKNQFDVIAWAVNKAKGTINDEQMIKTVLNSLFVTFLSFLIAHNWYSNFFTNQSYFRIEPMLKSDNTLIHYFTNYIVGIVVSVESFLMSKIPGYFNSLIDTAIFGKRSIFFIILMMSLSFVPYFLAQIMSIYGFLKSETIKLIGVIRNYNKSPVGLRNFIRDFISKIFSYIFLFKGNPMISGIIGLLFVSEYIKDLIPDFQFIVNSSIFYKIYLVLKFAIFYQPNVAFSSLVLTVYFFYFSVLRLPKINGIGGIFREMSANNEHMNKEKIKFSFSESIEKIINFIVENLNQIILLFIIKQNFPNVLKMDSTILKIVFIVLGIIAILRLLYSVLEKNGIGKEEKHEIEKNIEIVSQEFEKSIAESNAKSYVSTSFDEFMLQNMYKPYNKI